MFPTDLMIVKKSRKGDIRPVFLSSDSTDLAVRVIDFMKTAVNHNMDFIDRGRKEIEVRSKNHKVIRGLFLLMERRGKFRSPSLLDASEIRRQIFSRATLPVLDEKTRMEIFMNIASELKTDVGSVQNAMYGDKESEQILAENLEMDPEDLCKAFNMEQVETILMHSVSMEIRGVKDWYGILRRVKTLGLLCTIHAGEQGIESLSVSGPMSVLERSERYGMRVARLFRTICRETSWEIEASIMLKDRDSGGKNTFKFRAGDEMSDYFPDFDMDQGTPDGTLPINLDTRPLKVPEGVVVPYCSIKTGEGEIFINISIPQSLEQDRKNSSYLSENGIIMENIYIVFGTEKKIKGEICFRDSINWEELLKHISGRYPGKAISFSRKDENIQNNTIMKIRDIVDRSYPYTERMVEIIEEAGMSAPHVLEILGYSISWKGLSMIVERKSGSQTR